MHAVARKECAALWTQEAGNHFSTACDGCLCLLPHACITIGLMGSITRSAVLVLIMQ